MNATNKHTQPTKMMYNKQKKEVKSSLESTPHQVVHHAEKSKHGSKNMIFLM